MLGSYLCRRLPPKVPGSEAGRSCSQTWSKKHGLYGSIILKAVSILNEPTYILSEAKLPQLSLSHGGTSMAYNFQIQTLHNYIITVLVVNYLVLHSSL